MKSLFDNYWNKFKNVEHDTDKLRDADSYYRLKLAFPKGLEDAIFEQIPGIPFRRYKFVEVGYEGLKPTINFAAIQMRQAVISAFMDDLNSAQKFKAIFNNMHLLNEIFSFQYASGTPYFKHLCLSRYQEEADALVQELDRQPNPILQKLAFHYKRRCPRKILNNVIQASRQGGFNSIIVELNPLSSNRGKPTSDSNAVRLHGAMKLPDSNLEGKIVLDSCAANWLGIDPLVIVKRAAGQCMDWLNKIYAPLAALYTEAFYMKNNAACLPEINKDGVFEMVNGRPIAPSENPVGTDLYYDNKSAKVILNGIHSGGKSYLLRTIIAYHLCALSGFSVPADSARVPVVRSITHSVDIEKLVNAGSLESECTARAEMLATLKKDDLVLIDEFLQHASPDASADLEPIILDAFYKTGAAVIVVTHRGESLDDKNKWQFYSPGFKVANETIVPTYSFVKGRPSQEILRMHARQILENALHSEPENKPAEPYTFGLMSDTFAIRMAWHSQKCKLLLHEKIDEAKPIADSSCGSVSPGRTTVEDADKEKDRPLWDTGVDDGLSF